MSEEEDQKHIASFEDRGVAGVQALVNQNALTGRRHLLAGKWLDQKAADALRAGSPTFYEYLYDPAVSILRGKGLVWTALGGHDDSIAFSFHDFVWRALLERKDAILVKDEENRKAEEAEKRAQQRRRY